MDVNQAGDFVYKTLEVKEKDSPEECTISELKRASRYEIIVQAFNSKGAGPSSESIYVKTLEFGNWPKVSQPKQNNFFSLSRLILLDPPSIPQLQVSEVTFDSVRLSWTATLDQVVTGNSFPQT